ncbi:hypothetical protein F2P81_000417 [Scophthalmus maximus]|uniref:Uncharacterized protein n=1 Tax=Scophthalmus maximus TaxID=52904 RepID=A0A6A4TU99_SCOMX|nr:hypothetical protein F2P81_000417 [Scophthalmus maximus]
MICGKGPSSEVFHLIILVDYRCCHNPLLLPGFFTLSGMDKTIFPGDRHCRAWQHSAVTLKKTRGKGCIGDKTNRILLQLNTTFLIRVRRLKTRLSCHTGNWNYHLVFSQSSGVGGEHFSQANFARDRIATFLVSKRCTPRVSLKTQ